jgi:hypothetical protein
MSFLLEERLLFISANVGGGYNMEEQFHCSSSSCVRANLSLRVFFQRMAANDV